MLHRPFVVASQTETPTESTLGAQSTHGAFLGGLSQPHDGNLVDPASSHTLVSKIKPCMSKYKHLYRETANGSLYQL